jgi:Response regulator of the LytR/AlgR family
MIKVILVDSNMEFHETLQKILSEENKQANVSQVIPSLNFSNESQLIGLTDNDGTHFFEVRDVIYCVNDNSYTHFHIKTPHYANQVKKFTVSKGLGQWEDFLFEKGVFFRVHNRYMVNINYIKRFNRGENAYLELNHIQATISIARDKKNDFIKFLRAKKIVL